MSNVECTQLYERIIEDVIQESRQDFDDSGIDEQTLMDLRNTWRAKLSKSGVGKFTWDQQREEEEVQEKAAEAAASAASAAAATATTATTANSGVGITQGGVNIGAVGGTTGTAYTGMTTSTFSGGATTGTSTGYMNSAEFGETGLALPKSEPSTANIILPGGGSAQDSLGGPLGELEGRGPKLEQSDGAADGSDGLDGTNGTSGTDQSSGSDDSDLGSDLGIDSDEINSDLDDPEDEDDINSDEDNDDPEANIMLCLYDRVQRVRNRWKCNLKDGIANIDGRDYAFQKATGDSEW
ncbi:hypothetical protein FOA43_004583 [Brettanomyces nanus]|uniref:Transcription initiation factor IIA large subunit n=1 Tax=Eeniella nana TaxID=13502 RepID=A0A875RY49_EENNA|nr:uncharacterized protein FOA43_004583 [Brettanomyces nanus]QPG77177.1 hypothetical protein FOA43_004583 [Brettanomyces nanus]